MSDYESAREELRAAELELMLQRESVAEMRRNLPAGPAVEDYAFQSERGLIPLSGLFESPAQPLLLYHFMYGKKQTAPCPMCSMWADGWNAVIQHLRRNLNFAMVSAAPIDETLELARGRGWNDLRWLSAAENTFKADIGGEDEEGGQWPFISAYELIDGHPHLTYSGGAHITGKHWRGLDLFSPVWHLLDLTRSGRGDWMPGLSPGR